MRFVYNFLNILFESCFPFIKLISPKLKLFVEGRKNTYQKLKTIDFSIGDWLWFHCASLGEYEQAVPVIKKLKEKGSKIAVSFFSPSGYEQKKSHYLIDVSFYLPIDTIKNAKTIVNLIKPTKVFFVKYEFWENYFYVLEQKNIPIYMISSSFRENQLFFKWYGSFFKSTLKRVTHFFVQNENSKLLLKQNDFINVTVSGDTRFDRVSSQLQIDNTLDFIKNFKGERLCLVLGSTWPEGEAIFVDAINNSIESCCFIIAPHIIKEEKISNLLAKIKVNTSVYSKGIDINSRVLIVDTIGFLTRIYSYADIAYVGGGFGTEGLHNILEPATFGVPIIVGPNIEKFPEAFDLENQGGLHIVSNTKEFSEHFVELIKNKELRKKMSLSSANFIKNGVGATEIIISELGFNKEK